MDDQERAVSAEAHTRRALAALYRELADAIDRDDEARWAQLGRAIINRRIGWAGLRRRIGKGDTT
ncbi:MAG: hypothetical protein ABII82_20945 [Verrucomicrobiota bacterium]